MLDLHVAPWNGGGLLDALPVVYGVEVYGPGVGIPAGDSSRRVASTVSDREREPTHGIISPDFVVPDSAPTGLSGFSGASLGHRPRRRALVLANPTGDLPHATLEGGSVAAALVQQGWDVEVKDAAADVASVLEHLAQVDLFWYAGHAHFAGEEGWDSGLALGQAMIRVGDILALPAAPHTVVLMACESARPLAYGGETLAVAQAFALAGTRTVIGPSRPVADGVARTISEALATRLARDISPGAVAQVFRDVYIHLAQHEADGDWAAFRVFLR